MARRGEKARVVFTQLALLAAVACSSDATSPAGREQGMSPAAYDRFRQPDRIVEALGLEPGDAVADVGAGRGYLTPRLGKAVGPNGLVVATDVDPVAVLHLAYLAARSHGEATIEARLVAAADTGLEPGRYQRVLMAQVDHLLADPAAYLRAVRPALAPDGLLAVSNRLTHRDRLLDAAASAGYARVSELRDLPGQYLVLLRPAE